MGLAEDLAKRRKESGSKSSKGPAAATYDPRSTSLLQSQLRKVAKSGNEKALGEAKKVAKGGGGSIVGRALGDTLSAVGMPMRAVVATLEEAGERALYKHDDKTWAENVLDPTYGTGRVVERAAPHLPWAVKSGLGFVGDVALDPLTYLTFGAGPGIEAVGKSGGLARTAYRGAQYADEIAQMAELGGKEADKAFAEKMATHLRTIADKAGKGKALADDELREVEKATRFIATDVRGSAAKEGAALSEAEQLVGKPFSAMEKGQFAGERALPDKYLRYGVTARVPFTDISATIPRTGAFGRALSTAGGTIGGKVAEKLPALGGKLGSVKAAMRQGGPGAEAAAHLIDATRRGAAAKSSIERAAGEATGKALATLEHKGIKGEELTQALGERATNGPLWQKLAEHQNPKIAEAAKKVGDFYESIPQITIDAARAHGVERQFIGDAAKRGRTSYVPRVLSDEFKDWLRSTGRGGGQKGRPGPGEESWFMKKALSVGDKIGKGDTARELVETGKVTDLYPTGAPALETQIDDALGHLYGDAKVPWYEPDFYKAHEKYIQSLGHQVESQVIQNTLLARKVSRPTLAAALEDAAQPMWREDLFGPFDPSLGGRRSYSGKVVNQVEYGRLQQLRQANDSGVLAVNDQFEGNVDTILAHIDGKQEMLRQEAKAFGKKKITDAHAARLEAQVETWHDLRMKWEAVKQAEAEGLPYAKHMRLEASRDQIEATIFGHEMTWTTLTKDKRFVKRMSEALSSGWEGYGFNRQAPSDVVGLMKDIASSYESSPGAINEFLRKHYDPLNHWMKGWLTATPGFLERNVFGGTFNNWLAGVRNPGASTVTVGKLLRTAPEKRSFAEQAVVDIFDHTGVLNSGFFTSDLGAPTDVFEFGTGPGRKWSLNPGAGALGGEKQPIIPYANRRLNEKFVEPMLRGTLVRDRVIKAVERGRFASLNIHKMEDIATEQLAKDFVREVRDSSLMDEILADVAKYHFDYDDLSRFERQVGRRVIPFYTWTRKNVPLQLEAMFTQPGKTLAAYGHVKRNLESATPQQDVVPQWFGQAGMMRLPFQTKGGQVYGSVDLPFKDPFEALDVTGMGLGMISPLVKAPIETRMGRQFFGDLPLRDDSQTGGLKPMPTTWKWMIPLLVAADKLPFSPLHAPIRGKGGQWLMREDDNYLVQQYLPFMAQAQRLFPMEEGKYRNRVATTWLSYLAGVQARTNTPQDMENEVFRRSDEMSAIVNRLKVTGDIASTSTTRKRTQGKPLSEILASLDTG